MSRDAISEHGRRAALGVALAALLAVLAGCSTVRAYEKEHLADPLMTDRHDMVAGMREMKWLDAREGSTGGVGGAGGGCACK